MFGKNDASKQGRGDGGWLALSLSGLLMLLCYPQVFEIAQRIMNGILPNAQSDMPYLIIPIFVLSMLVGFFGLAVVIKFLPKLVLLSTLSRR